MSQKTVLLSFWRKFFKKYEKVENRKKYKKTEKSREKPKKVWKNRKKSNKYKKPKKIVEKKFGELKT